MGSESCYQQTENHSTTQAPHAQRWCTEIRRPQPHASPCHVCAPCVPPPRAHHVCPNFSRQSARRRRFSHLRSSRHSDTQTHAFARFMAQPTHRQARRAIRWPSAMLSMRQQRRRKAFVLPYLCTLYPDIVSRRNTGNLTVVGAVRDATVTRARGQLALQLARCGLRVTRCTHSQGGRRGMRRTARGGSCLTQSSREWPLAVNAVGLEDVTTRA